MGSEEIRKKFLTFFESRGHAIIPSASLVPENDSSVLFTTAGMQQFKPYYVGDKSASDDFGSLNTASVQKCVRTSDIEEVGDESHLTFFEMLGNFSFDGYFKEEAVKYAYEFITKEMGLEIDYVTIFEGDDEVPADEESERIWKSVDSGIEIKKFGREDNFWGPTGDEGPCGPTTEIYVNGIEIWNIVFNEYYCGKGGKLEPLAQKGVDTGMGLERLVVAKQKVKSVFDTDLFVQIVSEIKKLAGTNDERAIRIIADHIRTAVFMVADGVAPSNTDRGYILRRLLRRAIRYEDILGMPEDSLSALARVVVEKYSQIYSNIFENFRTIEDVISEENKKFRKTLKKGMKEFEKLSHDNISGKDAFVLFSTYGFPFEITEELAHEKGITVDENSFKQEMKKHQEESRTSSKEKFKGGLADHSEKVTMLHTATHLMLAGMRKYINKNIHQAGSNITEERTRFDFTHSEKVDREILDKVEEYVNDAIAKKCPVIMEEIPKEEAQKRGVEGSFWEKYPDMVHVYMVKCNDGTIYSYELCGGPHVKNTGDIKGTFKIIKEQSSSAGVRRVKAILVE